MLIRLASTEMFRVLAQNQLLIMRGLVTLLRATNGVECLVRAEDINLRANHLEEELRRQATLGGSRTRRMR